MKVQEITVNTRRQVKEYEFDEVKMVAILEDADSPAEVRENLLALCLGKTEAKAPEYVSVEEANKEIKEMARNSLPEAALAEDSAAKPPAKKVAKKKTTKKKVVKKKAKTIAYDRTLDVHKKEMGKLLDSIEPSWRKKHLDTAKELSIEFNQKEFLDDKGSVLESFRNELSAAFASRL